MKKISNMKRYLVALMMSVMMFGSTLTVSAAVSSETQNYIVENYEQLNSNIKKNLKTSSNGMKNPCVITLKDGTALYYEEVDSLKIDNLVENLQDSKNATANVNDALTGLEIGADTKTASEMLSGVTPIISTFLGLAVILITLFMTIFSAIDIVYIVFPATRGFLENANSKTKIQIVTDDAMVAVKQSSIENGKTPMGAYFGRRVISYIILSVMLFIILTGNISLITNLALRVVSGLLEILVTI